MFESPKHTQIPNMFFDELIPTLKEGELRVLLVIMRQTFGWHKQWDRIPLSQLMKKTGMEKRAVCNSVNSLIGKGMVNKHKTGKCGTEQVYYSLVVESKQENEEDTPPEIDEKTFENSSKIEKKSNNSYQYPKDTPPSILKIHSKETLTKEIATKKENKQRKQQPPNPQGGVSSFSSSEIEKQDRSAKLAISEEAKELVDYIQQKVKSSNANAISMNADKLSKDRKAADQLLKELEKEHPSPQTSGAPPSLRDKLELAKKVVDASFEDNFWGKKVTGASYLRLKWGQLSVLTSKTSKTATKEKNRKEAYEFAAANKILQIPGKINASLESFDITNHRNNFFRSFSYDDSDFWEKVKDCLRLNKYDFLESK